MLSHANGENPIMPKTRENKKSLSAETLAMNGLEDLLREPDLTKTPYFLILGGKNSRRTAIAKRLLRKHPPVKPSKIEFTKQKHPVVYINAPRGSKEIQMHDSILKCLRVQFDGSDHEANKIHMIHSYFVLFNVKMLIIDNFQDALVGPPTDRVVFMNSLKSLGDRLKVPVVLIGDNYILNAISDRFWISNKYLPIRLSK